MDGSAWISAASAVVAVVAVIFAGMQARYARSQAEVARRQTDLQEKIHQDSSQPYVWVDFRTDDRSGFIFDVVVKNEGPTVATDVVVTFDPPLAARLSASLGGTIRITSMPPGRTVRWRYDSGLTVFEDAEVPKQYQVTVSARGPFGPVQELAYVLDLNDYNRSAVQPAGSLHGISEAIGKLTTAVEGTTDRA
jgi:hypothetical protein